MAVVAVDPTSPFTGGALLGDRIRMESVALDQGVYIRSMASRGSLGGLATTTREVCDLLDAAGFDRILVETVGVGPVRARRRPDGRLDGAGAGARVGRRHPDAQVRRHGDRRSVRGQQGRPRRAPRSCGRRSRSRWGSGGATRSGTCRRITDGQAVRRSRRGGRAAAGRRTADRPRPTARPPAWDPPVVLTVAAKGEGVAELIAALDRHHDWLAASGDARASAAAGGCSTAPAKWWSGPPAAGSGTRPGPTQRIAERLDEIVAGRVSPYEVAAEVLDGLKQGERI